MCLQRNNCHWGSQFSSYIINQLLICKLWCSTFIWHPGEVAEADGNVIVENSRFINFWTWEACSTSKKFPGHQCFRFDLKLEVFFIIILKEINVNDFGLKIFVGFCPTRSIFWTIIQVMLKMTLLPTAYIIFEKVKKFQNSSKILWEMSGNFLNYGHTRPPPRLF